jgi:hypothetical protein
MRIVIHGGMHKTGTTALQTLLQDNRDLLAAHGVWYPDVGGQEQGMALNVRNPAWTPETAAELIASAAEFEIAFLSAEVVSAFSTDQLVRLRQAFDRPLSFVFCFRHWADFLPSRWVQNSKRRDSQSFDRYVAAVSANREHSDFWFDKVLARASAAPDCAVHAVSYQNAVASGETPTGAVLRAAGFQPALVAKLVPLARRRNERIDWATGELARLLNGAAAARLGLPQDDACQAVAFFRRRDRMLELVPRFHLLAPPLRGRLIGAVEARATERVVDELPRLAEATEALQQSHAGRFINLDPNGRVFPEFVRSRLMTSSFDWREFRDANSVDVEAALDTLLV